MNREQLLNEEADTILQALPKDGDIKFYGCITTGKADRLKEMVENYPELAKILTRTVYPLRSAVMEYNIEFLQYLVSLGASVDICGDDHETALIKVIRRPHEDHMHKVNIPTAEKHAMKAAMINCLIELGAEVNAIDQNRRSVLQNAVVQVDTTEVLTEENPVSLDIIKNLLDHGADPNHQDSHGNTAMHYILGLADQNLNWPVDVAVRVINLLRKHKANTEITNSLGVSVSKKLNDTMMLYQMAFTHSS